MHMGPKPTTNNETKDTKMQNKTERRRRVTLLYLVSSFYITPEVQNP